MRKDRLFAAVLALTLLLGACTVPALAEEGQISGMAWVDKPVDGLYNNEDQSLGGVNVTLEEKTGDGTTVAVASAVTAKNGEYTLAVPHAGEYRLHIELPSEYHFTTHGLDSAALPAKGQIGFTPFFRVEANESKTLNIGATKAMARVTMMVFEDQNRNGGRASAEPRLQDVHILLLYDYEGETYVVTEIVTPKYSRITTEELTPGPYRCRLILPEGYEVGPLGSKFSGWYNCYEPEEEGTGITRTFTVEPKQNQWVGAGVVRKAE